jgi:hypothetical protein
VVVEIKTLSTTRLQAFVWPQLISVRLKLTDVTQKLLSMLKQEKQITYYQDSTECDFMGTEKRHGLERRIKKPW